MLPITLLPPSIVCGDVDWCVMMAGGGGCFTSLRSSRWLDLMQRSSSKKPISPQTSPCKMRPASDRPSHGMRIKETKPKKTALPLVKPKDELVKDDTTQTESCIKLGLGFVSPYNVEECVRLTYELMSYAYFSKCNDPRKINWRFVGKAVAATFRSDSCVVWFVLIDPHHLVSRAMVLMVGRNRGEHLIRRFVGRGNAPDPRDVKIASLKQRIQELDFPQLQQTRWQKRRKLSPTSGTIRNESEPIIWDIGDEKKEYLFVNKYSSFQKEPIVLVEEESCPVYDTNNEEEESMPVYDTYIEDVIEEEE
nr:probable inactive histone-lysine N-methyltransferase SUVR2 [Tanacetum cinerariifolium]